MGWRPHEVYAVSIAEFLYSWEGWRTVHTGPGEPELMTHAELDELIRLYGDE